MIRVGTLIGFMSLFSIAIAPAILLKPASAQEQMLGSAQPTDRSSIRKFGRMDVNHPLHVGSAYYPKQALKNHEQGKCILAFFIEADGSVPAAQLLKSSGFPRLDTACFESVIGVPLIPAKINGAPIAGWYDFAVAWVIEHEQQPYQPPAQTPAFPRVADDYEFHAGAKFYPEVELVKHPKGYCVVHTTVGSSGTAFNASITRSTGSAILDKACLAAVSAARFTPELQDGKPVPGSADIAIYW
jgi:TonB family protein